MTAVSTADIGRRVLRKRGDGGYEPGVITAIDGDRALVRYASGEPQPTSLADLAWDRRGARPGGGGAPGGSAA